jgi:hypothetical protein
MERETVKKIRKAEWCAAGIGRRRFWWTQHTVSSLFSRCTALRQASWNNHRERGYLLLFSPRVPWASKSFSDTSLSLSLRAQSQPYPGRHRPNCISSIACFSHLFRRSPFSAEVSIGFGARETRWIRVENVLAREQAWCVVSASGELRAGRADRSLQGAPWLHRPERKSLWMYYVQRKVTASTSIGLAWDGRRMDG